MCWHSCLPVESSRMERHASGPGSGSCILRQDPSPLEGGKRRGRGSLQFLCMQFADLDSESSIGDLKGEQHGES